MSTKNLKKKSEKKSFLGAILSGILITLICFNSILVIGLVKFDQKTILAKAFDEFNRPELSHLAQSFATIGFRAFQNLDLNYSRPETCRDSWDKIKGSSLTQLAFGNSYDLQASIYDPKDKNNQINIDSKVQLDSNAEAIAAALNIEQPKTNLKINSDTVISSKGLFVKPGVQFPSQTNLNLNLNNYYNLTELDSDQLVNDLKPFFNSQSESDQSSPLILNLENIRIYGETGVLVNKIIQKIALKLVFAKLEDVFSAKTGQDLLEMGCELIQEVKFGKMEMKNFGGKDMLVRPLEIIFKDKADEKIFDLTPKILMQLEQDKTFRLYLWSLVEAVYSDLILIGLEITNYTANIVIQNMLSSMYNMDYINEGNEIIDKYKQERLPTFADSEVGTKTSLKLKQKEICVFYKEISEGIGLSVDSGYISMESIAQFEQFKTEYAKIVPESATNISTLGSAAEYFLKRYAVCENETIKVKTSMFEADLTAAKPYLKDQFLKAKLLDETEIKKQVEESKQAYIKLNSENNSDKNSSNTLVKIRSKFWIGYETAGLYAVTTEIEYQPKDTTLSGTMVDLTWYNFDKNTNPKVDNPANAKSLNDLVNEVIKSMNLSGKSS